MKFKNPMIVVEDINKSEEFYTKVLGLRKIMDFGANITMTGGVSMQTKESWKEFIGAGEEDISFGGNNFELYFEEEDFDKFIEKLNEFKDIKYVHEIMEYGWGQRGVRFYDPDNNIVEVGEELSAVCRRFYKSGMTVEEVAKRMDVPEGLVKRSIK